MKRGETKRRILDAGLRVWPTLSVRMIGRALGMSHSNVLYYFSDSEILRNAIAAHAVECGDSRVIRYLLAEGHAAIAGMSEVDRLAHFTAEASGSTI